MFRRSSLGLAVLVGTNVFLIACATSSSGDAEGVGGDGGSAGTGWGQSTGTGTGTGTGSGDVCTIAPCGGDVVGHWAYSPSCATSQTTHDNCSGSTEQTVDTLKVYLKGEITFAADGTVEVVKSVVSEDEWIVPKSCLFPGSTCTKLSESSGETCTDEGDHCRCTNVFIQPEETASDVYSLSGHDATFGSGDEADTLSYCVDHDSLVLVHENTGEIVVATRSE